MPKLQARKITMPKNETHYRYDDYHYEDGVKVRLSKFYKVYETPCFDFVVDEHTYHRLSCCNLPELAKLNSEWHTRKVMRNARRSHCYASKDKALNSYIQRKKKQLFHAETAISKATLALLKVEKMKPSQIGDMVNCGLDKHLSTSFVFD
jgi:hypothetical protein